MAAILHLGNIEFVHGKEADSSIPKDNDAQFHLETAAELFMSAFFLYVDIVKNVKQSSQECFVDES